MSILLLAAKGAKLIGPHDGLQVGKKGLLTGQAYMDLPYMLIPESDGFYLE